MASVHLNGTELHYTTAGNDGSPVLLVHGFPESWWTFRKLIPLLSEHHRVVAVDLRGSATPLPRDQATTARPRPRTSSRSSPTWTSARST